MEDPHACLFGTLSASGRGSTCPGDTCQLVMIDRIPFPRPDDPLMSARQRAADKAGGNGFMPVAATHAALLLAQGAGPADPHDHRQGRGRRSSTRGWSPPATAASWRTSLPPMWRTTDRAVVLDALRRLAQTP